MFHLCVEVPRISENCAETPVFVLLNKNTMVFAYEVHRDFLSAPRGFAVVKASSFSGVECATGGMTFGEEEWAATENLDSGVYKIEESWWPDLNHYLLLCGTFRLEFACEKIRQIETHYHCTSAQDAMLKSWNGLQSD